MTHVGILVLLKPPVFDIQQRVFDAMEPYNEELPEARKRYLDEEDIKEMANHYKIFPENLQGLAEKMEDWSGRKGEVDDGGLYEFTTRNPNGKWDWYQLAGRWTSVLVGNSCPVKEYPREEVLGAIVDPQGAWIEDDEWIVSPEWIAKFNKILDENDDCIAVVVDYHY